MEPPDELVPLVVEPPPATPGPVEPPPQAATNRAMANAVCKAALVANRSAAGMTLTCQKCGQLTPVPKVEEPSASTFAYADEIRGKLKENESQRAEVTGYINQLTIQLHRWQLRLQTLNERRAQLEKDLGQR